MLLLARGLHAEIKSNQISLVTAKNRWVGKEIESLTRLRIWRGLVGNALCAYLQYLAMICSLFKGVR